MKQHTRQRGFEKISFKRFCLEFKGIFSDLNSAYQHYSLPVRGTKGSAGYDLKSLFSFTLQPGATILIPTGLKAYLPTQEFLAIFNRSSLGIKHSIMLRNQVGIIDSDYYDNPSNEGHIRVCLYNSGQVAWACPAGSAIAQAVFLPFLLADSDQAEGVRLGGIGSTNKEQNNV